MPLDPVPPRLDVISVATTNSFAGNNYASYAIDGNSATYWQSDSAGSWPWLELELTEPTVIQAYSIVSTDPAKRMSAWDFEGWSEETGWDTIDSQSGQTFDGSAPLVIPVTVNRPYPYYRIYVEALAAGSSTVAINEFELYGNPTQMVTAVPIVLNAANSNAKFAEPDLVKIADTGDWYTSIPRMGGDREPGDPGAGFGPVWWSYQPTEDGQATFSTVRSGDRTVLGVYTGDTLAGLVAVAQFTGYGAQVTAAVTAGTVYRIRVAKDNYNYFQFILEVSGPTTRPGVTLVPVEVSLAIKAGVPAEVRVDLPPIEAETSSAVTQPLTVTAPAVQLLPQLSAEITRVRLRMLDPADKALVPFTQPGLTVDVLAVETRAKTVTVEIQYSLSDGFTEAYQPVYTLTRNVDLMSGVNVARVPVNGTLVDGQRYYWRARLIISGITLGWLPAQEFTVDTAAGDHTARATWSVRLGDPDPHLWYITPQAGVPGDLVTVVGQGFSHYRGTVTIGGVPMPVQSWTHMPPDYTAFTDSRVIDVGNDQVSPAHDRVVVIVPGVNPPGGPVVVVDSTGTFPPDKPPTAPVFAPPLTLDAAGGAVDDTVVPRPTMLISVSPATLQADMSAAVGTGGTGGGGNDNMTSAVPIALLADGGTVVCAPVANSGYSTEPGTIDEQPPGYRSAWWTLTLDTPGEWELTFDATASDKEVWLFVLQPDETGAMQVVSDAPPMDWDTGRPDAAYPEPVTWYLTTIYTGRATTLFVRLAAVDDVDATYGLTVTATKSAWSPSGPPPLENTNDSFASPTLITVPATDSGTITLPAVVNAGYTVGSDEPPPDPDGAGPLPGYRSAWWRVPGLADGIWDITFDATASSAPVHIVAFNDQQLNNPIYEMARAPNDYGDPTATLIMRLGAPSDGRMLIRVSSADDVDATYNLTVLWTAVISG